MFNSDTQHSFLIFSKNKAILKYFFQQCNNKISLQHRRVSNGNFLTSNSYYKEINTSKVFPRTDGKNKGIFYFQKLASILDKHFYHTTLIFLTSSIPKRISLILASANKLKNLTWE